MGLFDNNDSSEEEVQINPSNESSTRESKLKSEVESKVVGGRNKRENSSSTVSSVASGSRVSNSNSSTNIGIEDVYRQNERIIDLLEEIVGDDKIENSSESTKDNFDGDLNGVL